MDGGREPPSDGNHLRACCSTPVPQVIGWALESVQDPTLGQLGRSAAWGLAADMASELREGKSLCPSAVAEWSGVNLCCGSRCSSLLYTC
jgi:hypothetical protein